MTRKTYVYRVDVTSYPPRSHHSQPDWDMNWEPEGWESDIFVTVEGDDVQPFSWPRPRKFLSYDAAQHRVRVLASFGATAVIVRSLPVEWAT